MHGSIERIIKGDCLMKYLIFIFLLFLGGCDYDNDTTIYTNYTVVKKEVYVLYKKQTINWQLYA